MTEFANKYSTTIGVFSHDFQGPYSGELVNQLRQLCVVQDIRFVGFCTGSLGSYCTDFDTDKLDAAIIVRNSVSNDFAKKLIDQGTVVVSIAYDYFPLDIPVIDINHDKSVDLVFDYIREKQHRSVCFVGNLKDYGVRKRYERFLQCVDSSGFYHDEDMLISLPDSEFCNGMAAGFEFVKRECNASVVLTESSQITIGFISCLTRHGINLNEQCEVIGYGTAPLISVLCPPITAIDKNLHLVAYRAVSAVKDLLSGKEVLKENLVVEPKLIRKDQEELTSSPVKQNPYLAYSVDLAELYEPNYMAGLINNSYRWAMDIADSKLENLMSFSPMFEKYMNEATLTHLACSEEGKGIAHVAKHFTLDAVHSLIADNRYFCQSKAFPPNPLAELQTTYNVINHFFVFGKNAPKAVISVYGDSSSFSQCSSYIYFVGLMQSVSKIYGLTLEHSLSQQKLSRAKVELENTSIKLSEVTWNVLQHTTEWSKDALSLLGITSPLDINIYRNMEIYDRVMPSELENFRSLLAACATSGEDFCTTVQFRIKNGEFEEFALQAESVRNGAEIEKVVFGVGKVSQED